MKKVTSKRWNAYIVRFLLTIFTLSTLISSYSHALGLSTFRIYLDNDQRTKNFIVYNKDEYTQHCKQFLRHYEINVDGELKALPLDVVPDIAANAWIRFSPRHFSVAPGTSQTVKFQLKRRAKTIAAEYRAHLSLECSYDQDEVKLNNDIQYGLQPTLRHNIPIVVRTGKLEASIQFDHLNISGETLSVDILRSGERSVSGKLELIDSRSNQVISKQQHVNIYQEMEFKNVKLSTNGIDQAHLILKFSEKDELTGPVVVEQKLG
ncbi:hypothetical protein [Paraglaciecola sp. L1A13]|uniref:hypothetical protein n=1 Tax=Paraglaciecola sp. L1A13 TaxID=2686359 RepID=UPI00131DD467|nr:hypothetical protein [Paraglaciecola sp. L1A13]